MKYLIAFLYVLLVPALFWAAGFNFDQRGEAGFYCLFLSIVVFGAVLQWPNNK